MPEIPASHRDLLDGEFATLATIGPDGRPQLSEVWFLAEGDTVTLSLNTTRQKVRNLRVNPAANVFPLLAQAHHLVADGLNFFFPIFQLLTQTGGVALGSGFAFARGLQ